MQLLTLDLFWVTTPIDQVGFSHPKKQRKRPSTLKFEQKLWKVIQGTSKVLIERYTNA